MHRRGLLKLGKRSELFWTHLGRHIASVTYTVRQDGLQLGRDFAPFVYTRTAFNGRRRWVACPGCEKRSRVLYGYRGAFRCRTCHGLPYHSQYSNSLVRWLNGNDKLRRQIGERLGREFDGDDDFPPKPPKMRWRTYQRLTAAWIGEPPY